jgi:hypothetical protein
MGIQPGPPVTIVLDSLMIPKAIENFPSWEPQVRLGVGLRGGLIYSNYTNN